MPEQFNLGPTKPTVKCTVNSQWSMAAAAANEGVILTEDVDTAVFHIENLTKCATAKSLKVVKPVSESATNNAVTVKTRGGQTSPRALASRVHPVLPMAAGGERVAHAAVRL
ncbi:unnamed protein product [Leptosia nina]|uniref:Uncharacterized protein n=1 Tax=Leptosia nina TaxID=320188 RepID=A0AAV1K2Q9_9NEOP